MTLRRKIRSFSFLPQMNLQLRKDFLGDGNGLLNVLIGVGHGHETGFVHGRSKVDTSFQHHSVPLSEFLSVTLGGFGEVLDLLVGEIPSEHTSGEISLDGVSVLLSGFHDSVNEFGSLGVVSLGPVVSPNPYAS